MPPARYFLVLDDSDDYVSPPTKSVDLAREHAEELAGKAPGKDFRVLEIVATCRSVSSIAWDDPSTAPEPEHVERGPFAELRSAAQLPKQHAPPFIVLHDEKHNGGSFHIIKRGNPLSLCGDHYRDNLPDRFPAMHTAVNSPSMCVACRTIYRDRP